MGPTELATNHHQSGGDGCVSDVQGSYLALQVCLVELILLNKNLKNELDVGN